MHVGSARLIHRTSNACLSVVQTQGGHRFVSRHVFDDRRSGRRGEQLQTRQPSQCSCGQCGRDDVAQRLIGYLTRPWRVRLGARGTIRKRTRPSPTQPITTSQMNVRRERSPLEATDPSPIIFEWISRTSSPHQSGQRLTNLEEEAVGARPPAQEGQSRNRNPVHPWGPRCGRTSCWSRRRCSETHAEARAGGLTAWRVHSRQRSSARAIVLATPGRSAGTNAERALCHLG